MYLSELLRKNQRFYSCHQHPCTQSSDWRFVPHSRVCLIRRVLSSAVDSNYAMSAKDIIRDICKEFTYFGKLRKKNEKLLERAFFGLLSQYKQFFEYVKEERKYSLVPSLIEEVKIRVKDTTPTPSVALEIPKNQRLFACLKEENCHLSKPSFIPENSSLEFPMHRRVCLIRRILSYVDSLPLQVILDDICQEFPYYEEYSKLKRKLLHDNCRKILFNNDIFQRNPDKTWSLVPSTKSETRTIDDNVSDESQKQVANYQETEESADIENIRQNEETAEKTSEQERPEKNQATESVNSPQTVCHQETESVDFLDIERQLDLMFNSQVVDIQTTENKKRDDFESGEASSLPQATNLGEHTNPFPNQIEETSDQSNIVEDVTAKLKRIFGDDFEMTENDINKSPQHEDSERVDTTITESCTIPASGNSAQETTKLVIGQSLAEQIESSPQNDDRCHSGLDPGE